MDQSITQAKQKSSTVGRMGLIIFGLVFATIGALVCAAFVGPVLSGVVRSRNWVARPCVILVSQVEVSPRHDKGSTYRVKARYRYEWGDHEYVGDRYNWFTGFTAGRAGKQEIVNRLRPGTETTCFLNPANPTESILNRDLGWDAAFGITPLVFVFVGLWLVFLGVRSKPGAISDATVATGPRF